jgi:hypothetical protein
MVIDSLSEIVIEGEGAEAVLTSTGVYVKEVLIAAVLEFGKALTGIVNVIQEWSEAGFLNINMIKLYFLPMTILIKVLDIVDGFLGRLVLTLYVLNKTLPLTIMFTKLYSTAVFLASGRLALYVKIQQSARLSTHYLVFANLGLAFSFQTLAIAITGAFAALIVGFYVGKKLASMLHPLIPILLGLALAFYAMWAAASWGANAVTTLAALKMGVAALGGVGLIIGGISQGMAPPTEQSYPEIDAYMAQMEAPSYNTQGETSAQNLYVGNLNYNDANWSEFANNQMQTSAGANRYKGRTT